VKGRFAMSDDDENDPVLRKIIGSPGFRWRMDQEWWEILANWLREEVTNPELIGWFRENENSDFIQWLTDIRVNAINKKLT
jgi:hypothetical protein